MKGSELLRLAQLSAYAAARQLVDRVPDEVRCKGTAMDLVTDRDVEAEEAARATIELHRPEDSILAEEGEEKVGSSDVRWIVDALDGTVNYVAGIEDWAVSVAAEIFGGGGGLVASVVHAPRRGKTYAALRGSGAWCNGQPLARPRHKDSGLQDCVVATGFSPDPDLRRAQAEQLTRLLPLVRDVRCRGAASLELCAVASGEADAYYEGGLQLWDVAAGALIAREVGLAVSGEDPLEPEPLIAAPAGLAGELRAALDGGGG